MGRKFLLGTLKVGLDNISRPNIGFKGRKIGFEVNSQIQKQVFRTRFLKNECFFTINSNVDKKCILFHTEIIFQSGSKDFALVHHTFSSTNKSRSVSFPRWVYLISRLEDLIGRSEPSVPDIILVQMNNWKPETVDPSSQTPKSKSPETVIGNSLKTVNSD